MFESIGVTGRLEMVRGFLTFLISTAMHIVMILFLVMIPLVFFSALPDVNLLTFVFATPVPPPPPPIPIPPADPIHVSKPVRIEQGIFTGPVGIPNGVAPAPDEEPMVTTALPNGIQTGVFGAASGAAAVGSALLPPAIPTILEPPRRPERKPPTIVGGDVQQSKLLVKVTPEYPELARRARISGHVVMEIQVDEDGSITDIKVLSGHPLLVDAALKAARQWRYSPTLLNGEPVPVIATVTMVFHLQ